MSKILILLIILLAIPAGIYLAQSSKTYIPKAAEDTTTAFRCQPQEVGQPSTQCTYNSSPGVQWKRYDYCLDTNDDSQCDEYYCKWSECEPLSSPAPSASPVSCGSGQNIISYRCDANGPKLILSWNIQGAYVDENGRFRCNVFIKRSNSNEPDYTISSDCQDSQEISYLGSAPIQNGGYDLYISNGSHGCYNEAIDSTFLTCPAQTTNLPAPSTEPPPSPIPQTPPPLPTDINQLRSDILRYFKINFVSDFFKNPSNKYTLDYAWEVFWKINSAAPNFFKLVQEQHPIVEIYTTTKVGRRERERIYLRNTEGSPLVRAPFSQESKQFYIQNLIHELGHIVHGDPINSPYDNDLKKIVENEGFLTAYSAGALVTDSPICQNRQLTGTEINSYRLNENFAESVSYFINEEIPEQSYSGDCLRRYNSNPLYNGSHPLHFEYIREILGGARANYPDFASCKFTRGRTNAPIPNATLRSWISEIATKEQIPVGVLASKVMHENESFVTNNSQAQQAVDNNYYYIVSQVNQGLNKDTNAIGLAQISVGKTPMYRDGRYIGTADHCKVLLQTGILQRAAEKVGKSIRSENYYCVDNMDERVRRFCQTNRVIRNEKFYTPDKSADPQYINLCNLRDNIVTGAEFLKTKLGAGSWNNDADIRSAIEAYYGDCYYGGSNYCQEVVNDTKACQPQITSPAPLASPSSSIVVTNVFVNYNSLSHGGTDIINTSDGQRINLNRDALCSSGKFQDYFIGIRYSNSRADGTDDKVEKIRFILDNNSSICGTSALAIPKPEGLEYSCLDSSHAKVKWNNIPGTYQYALRVDNLTDGWVGAECVNGRAPNDHCYKVGDNNAILIVSPGVNYDFWIHTYDPSKKELSDASEHLPIICGTSSSPISPPSPISQPVITPPTLQPASCGNNQATVSWDNVSGAKGYDLRADPTSGSGGISYPANNCSPHSVCVNGYSSNSITLSLSQNKQYRFWIHTVGSDGKSTTSFSETVINCPVTANFTPSNLVSSCANNIVTLSWLGNSSKYALRLDKQTDNNWGPCGPGAPDDFCKDDITTNSYRFQIEPTVQYKWWVHGVGADDKYSDASVNTPFSCSKTQVFSSIDDINTKIICSAGNQVLFYRPSANASSHEVRLDNLADGWTGCSSPAGDSCIKLNPNVTTIDNIQRNTFYRIWYHDVYSNGSYGIAKGDIRFKCE